MSFRDLFIYRAPRYLKKAKELGLLPDPYENGRRIDDPPNGYTRALSGRYQPAVLLTAPDLRPHDAQGYDDKINEAGKECDREVAFGIYEVSNVKIWPEFGVHHCQAGNFLDIYCGYALSNPKYELPRLALPFVPAKKMTNGVFLGPSWYHNFYHWMVDIVPRLQMVALELAKGTPLIVPDYLSSAQNEILNLALDKLDLKEIQVVRLSGRPCLFNRLVMPTAMSSPLDASPAQRNFIRDIVPSEPSVAGRRLYISRRDAAIRRIANEDEIEGILMKYGFETIILSGRSIVEQANIFRHADAIISHHGAGLTNLAFCKPSTVAIEVFQRGHFTSCFARIAQLGGLSYGFAVGEPVGGDTWLDPNQLEELIAKSPLYALA